MHQSHVQGSISRDDAAAWKTKISGGNQLKNLMLKLSIYLKSQVYLLPSDILNELVSAFKKIALGW